jgi:tetratricopeptide (TPR) repeat protein
MRCSFLIALLISLFGSPSAQGQAPAHVDPRECFQGTVPESVIRACTAKLAEDPAEADALRKRAEAQTRTRAFHAAESDLDAAIAIHTRKKDDHDTAKDYGARGALFLAQRMFSKSIADFTKAIELAPDGEVYFVGRARALLESGDAKVALLDAERVRNDNYGHSFALLLRGRVYLALGRREHAIDDLRLAARLDAEPTQDDDLEAEYKNQVELIASGDYALGAALRELERLGVSPEELTRPSEPAPLLPDARQTCKQGAVAEANRFATASIVVEPGEARVGKPIKVQWSTPPGPRDVQRPAYLMVATPALVRFHGAGFFALAPGAKGPAGLRYAADRTRAIVPLHTAIAETSGIIEILPYAARPLGLDWAVVGLAPCGAWRTAEGHQEIAGIAAGEAQIAVRDEFGGDAPLKVVEAVNGPFAARVFKKRIEVYDRTTGALILDRQGALPRFSPTGRFISLKPPEAEVFEVIDLQTRRVLGRYVAEALAWSHADSLLYVLGSRESWLRIVRTLHGARIDVAETAIAAEGADGSEDWHFERARYLLPDGDMETYKGAGGNFGHSFETWNFRLSTTSGTLVMLETWRLAFRRVGFEIDPEIMVFDLTAHKPPMMDEIVRRRFGSRGLAFGEPQAALKRWDVGEQLILTAMQVQGGDGADAQKEVEPSVKELTNDDEDRAVLADMVVTPTGHSAGAPESTKQKLASASRATARRSATVLRAAGKDRSWSTVVGAGLDQLPHAAFASVRSGKAATALAAVAAELQPFFATKDAKFSFDPKIEHTSYFTQPFFDPNAARPNPYDEDPASRKPADFNLAFEGRDLWKWVRGSETYYLTQTVGSGRSAYSFQFTLLGSYPGLKPRFVDLLQEAGKAVSSGKDSKNPFEQYSLGDVRTELGSAFGAPSIVGVSGERYLTVMTMPLVPRLIVFDLAEWRIACAIPRPIDGSNAIQLVMHSGGRHVSQINANGSVHVYDCQSRQEVLAGAYVDDELVIMNHDGYFDGSEDAAGYVEMTLDGVPGRQNPSAVRQGFAVAGDRGGDP